MSRPQITASGGALGRLRQAVERGGVPWVVACLLAIDGVLIALHLGHALAGYPLGEVWAREFFELELEQNLPTWFASIQLAAAAVLLGIFAFYESSGERLSIWLLLPAPLFAIFMSLDEIAQIHEKVGFKSDFLLPNSSRAGTLFSYTGIWMFLIGIPFLLVILLLFRRLTRGAPVGTPGFRKLFLGFFVLVVGAGGVEMWANFTFDKPTLHLLQVGLEEGLELLGGTLTVWGALDLLGASGIRIVREPAG